MGEHGCHDGSGRVVDTNGSMFLSNYLVAVCENFKPREGEGRRRKNSARSRYRGFASFVLFTPFISLFPISVSVTGGVMVEETLDQKILPSAG